MHSSCAPADRRFSFSATACAVRPPTPASTSSSSSVAAPPRGPRHHPHRQRDPRQLASRGNARERARRQAGVGGQEQRHPVGPARAQLGRLDLHLAAARRPCRGRPAPSRRPARTASQPCCGPRAGGRPRAPPRPSPRPRRPPARPAGVLRCRSGRAPPGPPRSARAGLRRASPKRCSSSENRSSRCSTCSSRPGSGSRPSSWARSSIAASCMRSERRRAARPPPLQLRLVALGVAEQLGRARGQAERAVALLGVDQRGRTGDRRHQLVEMPQPLPLPGQGDRLAGLDGGLTDPCHQLLELAAPALGVGGGRPGPAPAARGPSRSSRQAAAMAERSLSLPAAESSRSSCVAGRARRRASCCEDTSSSSSPSCLEIVAGAAPPPHQRPAAARGGDPPRHHQRRLALRAAAPPPPPAASRSKNPSGTANSAST